jgi:Asp-tRNA(Asn)/Glu-tRNA(Gln) amidotransferase C subunit
LYGDLFHIGQIIKVFSALQADPAAARGPSAKMLQQRKGKHRKDKETKKGKKHENVSIERVSKQIKKC